MTQDHYRILDISRTATLIEIKKAYRKLINEVHPDKHSFATPEEKIEFDKRFKEIQEAYEVLSDPVKRKEYSFGKSASLTDQPRVFLVNFINSLLTQNQARERN